MAAGTFQDTRSDQENPFASQEHEGKVEIGSTLQVSLKSRFRERRVFTSPGME
jgi:hypothetical protein